MADTEVKLSFHRSLYMADAVKAAAEAYGAYCTSVDVAEGPTETVVTLTGFDPGYGDMFGDEFANFALGQSIVRSREALAGGL
jgi:hypothetical protein